MIRSALADHGGEEVGARSKFQESLRISGRNGERSGLAYSTLGLACLAGDQGDWETASTLHGIARSFLE